MELLFAYLAGLLTLINPCVLPVLPLVLGAALQSNRHAPLALAAGMSLSFVVLGMFIATLGRSLGLTDTLMAQIGAVMMLVFGLILLVPSLNSRFATATAGFSSGADERLNALQSTGEPGLKTPFLGGLLLGAVWSPCIGPTLGGAISLASQGKNLFWAFLIMCAFAVGVSTVIVLLGYGSREVIRRRQQQLRALAEHAKPIMGWLFIAVGLFILLGLHHTIEGWLVQVLPYWFQDLSVKF